VKVLLVALAWVLAAGFVGLAVTALFSGHMEIPRRKFLIPYVVIVGLFISVFFYLNQVNPVDLLFENWLYGFAAGVIVGGILAKTVLSRPSTAPVSDRILALDIVWLGIAYGVVDGLFLNVLPAYVLWTALTQSGLPWQIIAGTASLGASLLVTALYHLGYVEFRNRKMGKVLVGNTIITLAYLLSTSPLGAILSHTIMHTAAVIKGPESTVQLPPHYST
jgi:hypothetical protein